ncbi:DNA-binding beta-propeller fold protein YncE [Maribacter stanieri]|jgi:hypothetical protein|uniref:DNA-binding beta-propeller fold protein YncE n=1 Tax=Maribacter stanieri TaxID=440514 RepID=A0A1I6JDF9_9FLAO|nr:DNA-binding beta-propeller fold protein YncE [Maribacter stanieri]|tara:strand:+ start:116 stop:1276 length:1161 start_codon:yes stop_codon:yes gene_type:complete
MRKNIIFFIITAKFLLISSCGGDNVDNEEVIVTPTNQAPNTFLLLTVNDQSKNIDLKPTLTWDASTDPDNDPISYDLLLDNNSNPNTIIASNIEGTKFTFDSFLQSEEVYYWKVIANDGNGNSTESSVFSFTTIDLFTITDVTTDLLSPVGLAFNGDDLYYSEVDGYKVSKVNVSEENPIATDVLTELITGRLAFSGSELYISQPQANLLSKTDISVATPIISPVILGSNGPTALAFNGNELYVAAPDVNKIRKLNISSTTPAFIDVLQLEFGPRPDGLLLNGNDLYIALRVGNKIVKIDISEKEPVLINVATGLSGPTALALDGDILYIAEYEGNKISKIDVSSNSTTVTDVKSGLSGPRELALYGNELYIAEYDGNRISKINVH